MRYAMLTSLAGSTHLRAFPFALVQAAAAAAAAAAADLLLASPHALIVRAFRVVAVRGRIELASNFALLHGNTVEA